MSEDIVNKLQIHAPEGYEINAERDGDIAHVYFEEIEEPEPPEPPGPGPEPEPPPEGLDMMYDSANPDHWVYSYGSIKDAEPEAISYSDNGKWMRIYATADSHFSKNGRLRCEAAEKNNIFDPPIGPGIPAEAHIQFMIEEGDVTWTNANNSFVFAQVHDGKNPAWTANVRADGKMKLAAFWPGGNRSVTVNDVWEVGEKCKITVEYMGGRNGYVIFWKGDRLLYQRTGGLNAGSSRLYFKHGIYRSRPNMNDFRNNIGKWLIRFDTSVTRTYKVKT